MPPEDITQLSNSLTSILNLTPKKSTILRTKLTTIVDELHTAAQERTRTDASVSAAAVASASSSIPSAIVSPLLSVLGLACDTSKAKVIVLCVDVIDRLIALGLVQTDKQLSHAIDVAARGFATESDDEGVQLALIRCMRSALTLAPAAATPHAQPLLLLCRTIFDINVVSRSARARTEAKASLQEMLDFVCRRLDAPTPAANTTPDEDSSAAVTEGDVGSAPPNVDEASTKAPADVAATAGGDATAASPSKRKTSSQGSSNQFLSSLLASVSGPTNKPTAPSDWMPSGKISKDFDVNLIDCLLVFRALCRLSTREPDMRSAEPLRAKLFAMELLVDLLESHCARLARYQPFVELGLRRYLSGALLKNGVSPVPAVNRLAIAAFATLLKWIPGPMKAEIGVIFAKIWLPLVSSKHSTVTMKYQVLTLLWWVTASPQILVDLYVNYDCDVDGIDLFGSLVNALCAILSHTTKADVRGDGAGSGMDGAGGDGAAADEDGEDDADAVGANVTPCTSSFASFLRDVVSPSAPHHGAAASATAGSAAAGQEGAAGESTPHASNSGGAASGSSATNGTMDGNAHVRMTALRAFHALFSSLRLWARKDDAAAAANATAASAVATTTAAAAATPAGDADEGGDDGEAPTGPAAADADDDVVDRFRAARSQKQRIEEAKLTFARKPSKGLAALEELGVVEHTAPDIAALFRKMEGLDMTSIGAYIGARHDFNREVLSHYVASFDFTNMELDLAMRKFLSTFRLPGEAEIVDRILERFAERYFEQNKTSVFENADTAYVMAFSIMMLSTDLHNPSQKKKMTAEEWLSNNKKYVPGLDKNWNQEYMEALFARIAATPFELQGATSTAATPFQSANSSIARQALFMADAREMVRAGSSMIRQQANGSVDTGAGYVQATHAEHAEGMFETLAFPGIAAISMLLESSLSTSNLIFTMCLRCICEGAEVAVVFGLDTQRATYVTTLAKRTGLLVGSVESIPRLNRRHLVAVRALMSLAFSAGDGFKDSWRDVLDVASRVAQLRYIATGDGLHHVAEGGPPTAGGSATHSQPTKQRRRSEVHLARVDHDRTRKADVDSTIDDIAASAQVALSEASGAPMQPRGTMRNAQFVSRRVDFAAMESLYHTSSKLSGSAVLDFVSALCLVSADELANGERIYSLQRLVEVAHYNMDRVRWSWSRIWSVLAHHFESVCQSSNVGLAQFALDALRQLSIKFLAKDELANFTFQKEFLRPFERVMLSRPSVSIRELVIRCVSQMVYARAANIRSGWKSIFAVYTAAASDDNEGIVLLAFETVERIMLDFFDLIANRWFVETVHCLAAFGNNNLFKEIGLKALSSLERCAQQLSEGKVRWPADQEEGAAGGGGELDGGGPSSSTASASFSIEDGFTDSPEHIGLWFPILIGLARITSHPHIDVRSSAVEALFRVLSTHGQAFSEPLWRLIFSGVLLPIFDSVLGLEPGETDEEWLNTTCLIALRSLVSLVTESPPDSSDFMVDATLDLFSGLQKHGNPALTELTSACLLEFVARNMDNDLNWMRVMETELTVIETGWAAGNATMVQDAVATIVRIADSQNAVVSPAAMVTVFEALTQLNEFPGDDAIAAHRLQTRITRAALTIGFRSFEAQASAVVKLAETAARRYGERGAELVDELPGTSEDRDEALRQCDAVINSLLVCVLALDDETIRRHVRLLYSVLVSLVAVDAPELRQLVARGLRRLGAVCFDLPDASAAGVKSDA